MEKRAGEEASVLAGPSSGVHSRPLTKRLFCGVGRHLCNVHEKHLDDRGGGCILSEDGRAAFGIRLLNVAAFLVVSKQMQSIGLVANYVEERVCTTELNNHSLLCVVWLKEIAHGDIAQRLGEYSSRHGQGLAIVVSSSLLHKSHLSESISPHLHSLEFVAVSLCIILN